MRTIVIAALLGLFGGTGVASAQDEPAQVPFPKPITTAIAGCADPTTRVDVALEDRDKPYNVTLLGSAPGYTPSTVETTFDDDRALHVAHFTAVPPGTYEVRVDGADQPSDGVPVTVAACADTDPIKGELDVSTECRAGWGIATFRLANTRAGDVRAFKLSVYGGEPYTATLAGGQFLTVTENGYDDGAFNAVLTGDGLAAPLEKRFTVSCAEKNPAAITAASECDRDNPGSPASISVELRNPNRSTVDYSVVVAGQTRALSLDGGGSGMIGFDPTAPGEYEAVATGSDKSVAKAKVTVGTCGGGQPTTEPTTPPSTEPSTGPSTPAPQGGVTPPGNLPDTGVSAVGEMVLVGLGVIAAGVGLLLLSRRRRGSAKG